MFDKPFDQIDKGDVDTLIAEEVAEGKRLEYKEKLPGGVDKEKIEFVADVSSFANAAGGYIIYGLRDKQDAAGKNTGTPAYVGLGKINADEQKLRLEHIILNGTDPRVLGIQMRPIEGFDNGPVMLIKIPQSWASPHMVKHNNRFYSRTSSGKYPLDTHEIRVAFALSEALPERIRRFRDERLGKIVAGETPVKLESDSKVVLHVLPVASFDRKTVIDITFFSDQTISLPTIGTYGGYNRFNFDGYLSHGAIVEKHSCWAYTQLFRNGVFEAVTAHMIQKQGNENLIWIKSLEGQLISVLQECIELEKRLGLEPPIIVTLSLLGVKGCKIYLKNSFFYDLEDYHPIDKNNLILPELIINDHDPDLAKILRPAFDTIWQAAGFSKAIV